MENGEAAIGAKFKAWDRLIARLQERSLSAPAPEAVRLRGVLAGLAAARERAWSRWEVARAGGMWVTAEDIRRFEEAMREAEAMFARAAGEAEEGRGPVAAAVSHGRAAGGGPPAGWGR